MKRRDQRRAEELADIAAKLENKKVEYHPYQFINKIEENWRRKNPTSDRNWAPNKLLNKCLPNYRLKLVDSNEDLELSEITYSELNQNILETSLSTVSAEDDGEVVVVDRGLVVAVEELSVKKNIVNKETEKKDVIEVTGGDACVTKGNATVVGSSPNEVHILNLPCDCALCRKVALRKLAREQSAATASMQTTEKVQGLSVQSVVSSLFHSASLESLPPANEDTMEVGKSSTRKSSLRPSTATDRSSSRLVEQLRGNISKQRAVNFNAITQITDSVSSSGEKSYHKEVSVVKSSKSQRERDRERKQKRKT